MGVDPNVLDGLASAVEAAPTNHALRAHYAALLADAGDHDSALAHSQQVLNQVPDHVEALQVALRCAEATGEQERAQGYRRLLEALGATVPSTPNAQSHPSFEPAPGAPDQGSQVLPFRVIEGSGDSDD